MLAEKMISSCLKPISRCCRPDNDPAADCNMSSDRQPLLPPSPHPSPPSRKRRNTTTSSPKNCTSNKPYERPSRIKVGPILNCTTVPVNDLSPGVRDRNVEQWLRLTPDPQSLSHPDNRIINHSSSEVISIPPSELKKFVMIQVFERDTLLKNDLIPLSETDNMEICISYSRQERYHPETTDFRAFQISSPDSTNYLEFKRQFGKGIRLFCREGKMVQLMKSTQLMTFYGTKATPDWEEIKYESRWEDIFDFQKLKPRRKDRDLEFDYNKKTACVDNAVRVTVGCEPNAKRIYETEFHIKLSFIVH